MQNVITVRNLEWSYSPTSKPVLKGISLDVEKGQFVSIIGPTGAGKSTLCLTLNGTIPHSVRGGMMKGKVIVCDMDTKGHTLAEFATKVGMTFEEAEAQLFAMTVEEELAFGPESLGINPDEIGERIDWVLHVVRMEDLRDRSPSTLSGGQKKRLAVAAALAMLPEVLVLDDPTFGLDPIGTVEVLSVLKDLKERRDMTVVLASNEIEDMAAFSDRIVLLNDGKVIWDTDPKQASSNPEAFRKIGVFPPEIAELAEMLNKSTNSNYSFATIEEAERDITATMVSRREWHSDKK